MIFRDFKGLKLSGLGLGMMRLPVKKNNDAEIDEELTGKMIDYAYQNGINYFDTAWGYHNGNSELMAGKFLSRYPRESYYLASKFPGYDPSNMGKVEEIFEKQLEKCRTTYFDFYLFHNVYEGNIDGYLDEKNGILAYLLKQKENGRIRHLGFSAHGSVEVIKRFLDACGTHMEFCQLQVNYMDWHFQNACEKVGLIEKEGIPLWVMEPLRGGKLASMNEKKKETLALINPDLSAPEWAFRFLQSIPSSTVVLSGMSNMEQLIENIEIWKEYKPLTKSEVNAIIAVADGETGLEGLACTACHYCISHCPNELPIPELIALYNEHKITGGGFIAPMAVGSMEKDKRPSNCIGCKNCETVCPQEIKISDMLKEFSEILKKYE